MVYIPAFETQRDENAPLPWTNCNPASAAMLVDLWTYGAVTTSDVELRRASPVPLDQGMNFRQVAAALAVVAPELGGFLYSERDGSGNRNLAWAQLRDHLAAGGGAVVCGSYDSLAAWKSLDGLAVTRWQPGGTFGHACFTCDYRPRDAGGDGAVTWMDPLGHGSYTGDRIPLEALYAFVWRDGNDASARVTAAHSFTAPRPAPTRFADVRAGHPQRSAIEWAADAGLMKGVSETRFAPEAPLTRGQAAVVLQRLVELTR